MIHAAGESSTGNLADGTYAVALVARSLEELHSLEEVLIAEKVPHKAIREPDDPHNGSLVAIGICPDFRTKVRRFVSNLPLIK